MKILFVCRGNIGRSQIAEEFFRKYSKHHVSSAGTKADKNGKKVKDIPLAKDTIQAAKENDISIAEKDIKQLTEKMVKDADKIIVMAEKETFPKFLLNGKKVIIWKVDNPKHMSKDENKRIVKQIDTLVKKFIRDNNL